LRTLITFGSVYFFVAWIFDWWPFDPLSSSDPLPLSEYEKVTVDAFFYTPTNTEIYLGRMTGASACGHAARSYAQINNIAGRDWDYICCTVRLDSNCYEKIR